jgi:hypothetical protein
MHPPLIERGRDGMSKGCPTCGRNVDMTARYCRACYTVFRSATAVAADSSSFGSLGASAFKLLGAGALMAGGWWAYNLDRGPHDPEASAEAAPVPHPDDFATNSRDAKGSPAGSSGTSASAASASTVSPPGDRAAAAAAIANASDWRLAGDVSSLCGGAGSCRVMIRFDSGETAAFTVGRSRMLSGDLVPAGPRGAVLLSTARRGNLLVPRPDGETRSVSVVRLTSRRWVIV